MCISVMPFIKRTLEKLLAGSVSVNDIDWTAQITLAIYLANQNGSVLCSRRDLITANGNKHLGHS